MFRARRKRVRKKKNPKIHVCIYFYTSTRGCTATTLIFLFYKFFEQAKPNLAFVPWREAIERHSREGKKPVLAPYSNKSQSLFHNLSLLATTLLCWKCRKKSCMRARDDEETQRGLRESYRNRPTDLS